MRALALVVLVGSANAETRNEVGWGLSLGPNARASPGFAKIVVARSWTHLSLRFDYGKGGIAGDDDEDGVSMHRAGATLRIWSPVFFRERDDNTRVTAYFDVGIGEEAIRWENAPTEWRHDFVVGAGIRANFYDIPWVGFLGIGFGAAAVVSRHADGGHDVWPLITYEATL